jgi:N-acetylglucosamine kinase-like BadF-type ATPase
MQTDLNDKSLFLGVDGGQSHTEAIVADVTGRVIGRGVGSPSVTTDFTGGEQLEKSVKEAIAQALGTTQIPGFKSAYFGLTGTFHEEKRARIAKFLDAEKMVVDHDAPSALFGALVGRPGVVVISGTGSVVLGKNSEGATAAAGGLGYLFSDEGSGFWTGVQAIRTAILERDGVIPEAGVHQLVRGHFGFEDVESVAIGFYSGKLCREDIAALARTVQDAVDAGGNESLERHLDYGSLQLAEKVRAVSSKLGMNRPFPVAGVGGMFRGKPFRRFFIEHLKAEVPFAEFSEPEFGPCEGALLLAYVNSGVEIKGVLLENLRESLR